MSQTKLVARNTADENREIIKECLWTSDDEIQLVESMQRKFGVDIRDNDQFPVNNRKYSWKKCRAELVEADSEGAFPQVLRAGVQNVVNSMYQTVVTTFEEWTHTVQSNKAEELYAPLQGISFLSTIGENEVYPESGAVGLSIALKNYKYGTLFPVTKELLDDDQTGQFNKQSSLLGVYAKQVLEVLAYGKLASVANAQYANIKVPTCETVPVDEITGYPFTTTLVGGGSNRPVAYGALTQFTLQSAYIALMNQLNKLGLKMNVQPDKILVSPFYNYDVKVLLNSAYYPTGSTPGVTGGTFSINPIEGVGVPVISRFMFDQNGSVNANSKAWYVCDSKVPFFVVQLREAAAVEMEAPNSGLSFDRDVIRFKVRTRANADFIDSRFIFRGSDGSV